MVGSTIFDMRLRSRSAVFSILYRMKLVEQIGSGIRRIHDPCLEHGVAEPAIQVSPDWLTMTFPRQVAAVAPQCDPSCNAPCAPHVGQLVAALEGEVSRAQLMDALGLADRRHFARTYLQPSVEAGLVEMTLPGSPRSRTQKYRVTALGRQVKVLSRLTRVPESARWRRNLCMAWQGTVRRAVD